VTVEPRYAGKARVAPGGFAHSVPGNTVMFVMLVALTYGAGSISAERQSGMLRRIATCPVSRADIILGKIIGRMAVATVQVTVLVLVCLLGARFFGEVLGGRPLEVWAILILFGRRWRRSGGGPASSATPTAPPAWASWRRWRWRPAAAAGGRSRWCRRPSRRCHCCSPLAGRCAPCTG
jgi:hypothetical protein